jgi:hypothetical protein
MDWYCGGGAPKTHRSACRSQFSEFIWERHIKDIIERKMAATMEVWQTMLLS